MGLIDRLINIHQAFLLYIGESIKVEVNVYFANGGKSVLNK